jgi:four helix bundle protein
MDPQNRSEELSALQLIALRFFRRIPGVVSTGDWLNGLKCIEVMAVALRRAALYGMSDFKNLHVWQKAHALALHAHRAAMGVRAARYASVRSQIIRSATSIPTNIVEGGRQDSERDFARFLGYSLNSAYELEYHLMLARDMEVMPDSEASALRTS